MKHILFSSFLATAILISGCQSKHQSSAVEPQKALSQPHEHKHWSYSGHEGPEFWGELSEEFAMCKHGKNQSPVNITQALKSDLEPLKISYVQDAKDAINNGHTVQANFNAGNTLTIDGKIFTLKQFHFHTPSENHIEGKSFPMEAHLVHVDAEGAIAVVAVMIIQGAKNKTLETLAGKLPTSHANEVIDLSNTHVSASDLLPKERGYDRFSGSLTTPPCTEGVRWIVLRSPIEASKEEIAAFHKTMGHNNRPIQPINAREILK